MNTVPRGIAHISSTDGGLFLPTRSAYDRQMLAEHVVARVRATDRVQVLTNGRRWMVYFKHPAAVACSRCADTLEVLCYSGATAGRAFCVRCALGDSVTPQCSDPAPAPIRLPGRMQDRLNGARPASERF